MRFCCLISMGKPGVSLCAPASSLIVKKKLLSQKGEKTMFKRNEGILDRIVRVGLGMVLLPSGLLLLGIFHSNVLGLLAAGLGVIGLITGFTGVCPTYTLFGISTLEKEKELIAKFKSRAANCRSGGYSCGGRMWGSYSQSTEETQNQPG